MAHICASMGWTWDYVAECVDLPMLKGLQKYWEQHPPVHVLVGSYMKALADSGQSRSVEQSEEDTNKAIEMLMSMVPRNPNGY